MRGETACALIVNGQTYVLDCGYGALRGLMQANLDILKIGQFFLTHLHVDHTADLAAILGLQWTQGRTTPTTVYGPYGTDDLVTGAMAFNAADVRIRTVDEMRTVTPQSLFTGIVGAATDTPTMVYQDANITVTSVQNTHYSSAVTTALMDRSLSYRIESANRKLVFSGDTAYSDNLVQLAQGADILVCEAMDTVATRASFDAQVAMGAYGDNPEGVWNHIVGAHSPCADAGRMAAAAGVKTLVLYHLVPGALNGGEPDQNYIDQVTATFSGKIIVAADQMIV
jgi:ribonuclease BN (tRNA processing enzyme)